MTKAPLFRAGAFLLGKIYLLNYKVYYHKQMTKETRFGGLVDPTEIGSECEARCSSTNSVMHS